MCSFQLRLSSMCIPRSFPEDDWDRVVPQMEMLRGSDMVASFLFVPTSITLVLSGCTAILISDAQVARLSTPDCKCVRTVLIVGPELTKVVSST